MALELLNAGCTITVCHSATRNLKQAIQQGDLLVSAIGKADIIQSPWIKPGAIVIDIGITRSLSGKLHGDIAFESAQVGTLVEYLGHLPHAPVGSPRIAIAGRSSRITTHSGTGE